MKIKCKKFEKITGRISAIEQRTYILVEAMYGKKVSDEKGILRIVAQYRVGRVQVR